MKCQAVRVHLDWIKQDNDEGEDPLDVQIMIDLVIDTDTYRTVGTRPAFGVYGAPTRETACPFVLRADGRVDYGNLCDAGDRWESFRIHHHEIKPGSIIGFKNTDDEEWEYRIRSVSSLEEYAQTSKRA